MPESPQQEQEICLQCGFCCDGTLFSHAVLEPGERKNLPSKLARQYVQYDDQAYFSQPCAYFNGCCTIYTQPKPQICSRFRCQLLRSVEAQTLLPTRALQLVRDAQRLRTDIYGLYQQTFEQDAPATFIRLQEVVTQAAQNMPADDDARNGLDRLVIKCVMLEYLLAKTFKTASPVAPTQTGTP